MYQRRNNGFTLVELLIVIVIIAILAALTIVTYGNIKTRATNAKIVSNVRSYFNIIQSYNAVNSAFPTVPSESHSTVNMVCLGVGYNGGTCGKVTGKQVYESTTFMDKLKSITPNTTPVNFDPGTVGTEDFVGAVYGIDVVGPPAPHTGYGRVIEWFLIGEHVSCGVSGAYGYATANGNTACELFIEAV